MAEQNKSEIDQQIARVAAAAGIDAAKTRIALANVEAEGPAPQSVYKDLQDQLRNAIKGDLALRETYQVNTGTAQGPLSRLYPSTPAKEMFDIISDISPDAGKTFLAFEAMRSQEGGQNPDLNTPGGHYTAELKVLLAAQMDMGIALHGNDRKVIEGVRTLLGERGVAEAKQAAADFNGNGADIGQAGRKTFKELAEFGSKAADAAQKAIDAGISSGHAQVEAPGMPPDLSSQAKSGNTAQVRS